ncbi:MAG TPA: hypothetical protein VF501_02650 [Thiobacillus sp.]
MDRRDGIAPGRRVPAPGLFRPVLRDQTGKGRFKLDDLVPVADKAVVAGSSDDGATFKDAAAGLATLRRRITWL